jgi:hypothetical protein
MAALIWAFATMTEPISMVAASANIVTNVKILDI